MLFLLIVTLLLACGGSSPDASTGSTPSAGGNNPNSEDGKYYTGFYELTDSEKKGQASQDWEYHDGYFIRHQTSVRKDGEFVLDVLTLNTFINPETGEEVVERDVDFQRGISVEVDNGVSDIFLLNGKTNYIKVYLTWNPMYSPEILLEHKYFACDPDDLEKISGDLFSDDFFELIFEDDVQWKKGEITKIFKVDRPGRIGLCRQYKDYEAILYDVLEVKEYPGVEYKVSVVNVGSEQELNLDDIKEEKGYFYRAGVDIDFSNSKQYNVPDDFRDGTFDYPLNPRGNLYIHNRNQYLFVRGVFKDESEFVNHNCYEHVRDDLTLINDRIMQDMAQGILNERVAVIYNNLHVLFWSFYNYSDDYVLPCFDELTNETQPKADREYKVVILNTDPSCDRYGNVFDEDGFTIDYSNMYLMYTQGVGWKAYSTFNEFDASKFKDLFDPKCHVMINRDRFQNPHYNNTKYDLRSIIPENALGMAVPILFGSSIGGLMSYNRPDGGIRTFMHELGHVLGLSDVQDDFNLMNWTNLEEKNKVNRHLLSSRRLKSKKCSDNQSIDCSWEENGDVQWDCLNDMDVESTCLNVEHRRLY